MNAHLFTFIIIISFTCVTHLVSSQPEQFLRDSIAKGNLAAVQKLLKENPELANATIKQHAKGRGHYELSALCFALQNGQPDIAKLLLSADADPTKNTDERNLLCYAARGGYTDLIPSLVQKGADPNVDPAIEAQKTFGTPRLPLSLAKDAETAQVLLDCGADVNAQASNGETPLHWLATHGNIKVALLLIENGADVNAKDNRGCTPLHRAGQECLPEKVRFLIHNGADVNAQDNKGRNALRRTIEERSDFRFGIDRPTYYDTLQLLIANGSDADAGDLVFAGDLVRLKEKLKNDPELIHTYKFHRNPLLVIAIAHGHGDIVKYLVEQGADIKSPSIFGFPLLHLAAFAGNPNTVELLIHKGLDVNEEGRHGELALHWVSKTSNSHPYWRECRYDQIAKILIEAGSNLNATARQAWISVDVGIDTEEPVDQVSHYLNNLKASRASQAVQLIVPPALAFDVGDTPLHSAARWGRTKIVNLLIEAGAQIDPQNALNQTPLHYAVVYSHPEVVRVLLTAGANPKLQTNKNMDAFQFAKIIDDSTIVSPLSNLGM